MVLLLYEMGCLGDRMQAVLLHDALGSQPSAAHSLRLHPLITQETAVMMAVLDFAFSACMCEAQLQLSAICVNQKRVYQKHRRIASHCCLNNCTETHINWASSNKQRVSAGMYKYT